MKRTAPTILIAAMTASVVFAGCTDADAPAAVDDSDPSGLQEGKGALKGILLDDRYRPIHLVESDANGEFQAVGFILIQETAAQVQTNEDGEFQAVNLAPGTYTLRVQSDGHEAKATTIQVQVGTFAEVTLEARRIANEGSTILTQENSVYIACAADYFANGGNFFCDGDLSPDSYSSVFYSDFSGYEDATYMVVEMLANQEKGWEIQVRHNDADVEVEFPYFAAELNSGDYVRIQMEHGVNADDHQDNPGYTARYGPWDNLGGFDTIVFVDHPYREEHQSVTPDDPTGIGLVPLCCGTGFTMGVKAKFLQSVFLGPPETDVDTYCILCN